MTEKKCNLFRYIASGLLIFHVIGIVISGNIDVGNLLTILADAIIVVTLLIRKDRFFLFGIVICVIHIIYDTLYLVMTIGPNISNVWYFLQLTGYTAAFLFEIVSIAPYVLIIISLFDVNKYKKLGLISAGLLFCIDILVEFFAWGFIGILSGFITAITSSIPIVLAVIAIQNSPQSQPIVIKKRTTSNISTGEKLTKLKELVDMGAITQEEFDNKKKEFLNL